MYEEELKQIIQASHNNALTFFVGAGLSALSGAPSWKGLIDKLCVELNRDKKDCYSADEYLQIPQMYYYSIGKEDRKYYAVIKDKIISSSLLPNDIHHKMLRLNPVSFITTNYDELLEEAAIQHCQGFKIIACDSEVPQIYGDKFILKIHGDFRHENIVLKEEDYLNYSDNFKLIETMVKSIFSTNTVVFIGYSLNDYNIKLILNWTKTLLGTNFRKPIFIYSDPEKLSNEELQYHESKGLSVIDTNHIALSTDYLSRYQAVFNALVKMSKSLVENKTEDEAFDMLYDMLSPLDKLSALRVNDVSSLLNPHVFSKNIYSKYNVIIRVFKKARIHNILYNHNNYILSSETAEFGDKNCIAFNYSAMRSYTAKKYKDINKNFRKAYYYARLDEFDNAFFLFTQVAAEAFKSKNYLIYYLAEANCINLKTAIKNRNRYYHCYDLDAIESVAPTEYEIEHLFDHLPTEFREAYFSLKDLHSANLMYKYSYEASIDSQKLAKAIESHSTEFGLTSSDKVICRINSFLHFLLGNGIVSDIFSEYKNTIKILMSQLVRKYAIQDKRIIHEEIFPHIDNSPVYFDEVDFYCFIDCFTAKEINELFAKYHIDSIEFKNIGKIETAVENIIEHYEYAIKHSLNNIDVINLQIRIKTCLMLLRYMDISQRLVDLICSFILNNEFREILINDKILFLDWQFYRWKKTSQITAKTVESKLINYLDQEISALICKTNFDVSSTDSRINYSNLVEYIHPEIEGYVSHKLSLRISQIMKHNLIILNHDITNHYCFHVSIYQKRQIIKWAKKILLDGFRYDIFSLLIQCNAKIDAIIIEKTKEYLRAEITKEQNKLKNTGIERYPKDESFGILNNIGFFCLTKHLKNSDFSEFVGFSPVFDFYYQYEKFDYTRFNVSWLLRLTSFALEKISSNERAKKSIREAIAKTLSDTTISEDDLNALKNILIKYFC